MLSAFSPVHTVCRTGATPPSNPYKTKSNFGQKFIAMSVQKGLWRQQASSLATHCIAVKRTLYCQPIHQRGAPCGTVALGLQEDMSVQK
jgi:hypothetical protein